MIREYEKTLKDFSLKTAIYAPPMFLKDVENALNDYFFAKKHGNIEIVVFSGVILLYNLLEKVRDDNANFSRAIIKANYGISKDDAAQKLQKFKTYLNHKKP